MPSDTTIAGGISAAQQACYVGHGWNESVKSLIGLQSRAGERG